MAEYFRLTRQGPQCSASAKLAVTSRDCRCLKYHQDSLSPTLHVNSLSGSPKLKEGLKRKGVAVLSSDDGFPRIRGNPQFWIGGGISSVSAISVASAASAE
ncbi:hypothetical protein PoB_007208900 [Plakobranchus ocellatus]|uniref:Uncharacterized protein n=1 Tax=Plakobranchus ocellatus TaxID=259542 RepID=A0AAV4DNM7_9GAST|nr:hypothetical protein PoB_007208900 [Plakobranchus ocellatus]